MTRRVGRFAHSVSTCGRLAVVVAAVVVTGRATGFEVSGSTWPNARATFEHAIPVGSGDPDWNAAFIEAIEAWNASTPFTYARVSASADPCDTPGRTAAQRDNGVTFSTTNCGDPWGSNTLAVAISWTFGNANLIQTGIVFNANRNWSVFSGSAGGGVFDFRRVALHELGHSLGLAHSDISNAIMRPNYSASIETLRADDIAAVEFAYADLDGDGIFNASDTDRDGDSVANTTDAFPDDPSETEDSDGDGVGDNGDAFPFDPGETADSDGDGVGDNADVFPDDPSESLDSDGDGVGDNGDAFPFDPDETADSDGDGVGDNADAFPDDPSESLDSDGDGVGDNGDAFPFDPDETADSDGDGVGDNADAFPDDPSRSTATAETVPAVGLPLAGILAFLVALIARRPGRPGTRR